MAIKRGNGGHRKVNGGPQKARRSGTGPDLFEVVIRKEKGARTLGKLAEFIFHSIVHIACTLNLVPMKYEKRVCSLTTRKLHLFLHYSILITLFARFTIIIYICSGLVLEGLNTTTLISLTFLTLVLFCVSMGGSSILMRQETVQLVNCWRQVLEALGEIGGRKVGMFEDSSLSMKMIGLAGPVVLGPLIFSVLPFVYPELPISLHYQTKQVFPEFPDFWSQLLCFPVEMTIWLAAILISAYGACVFIISIDLGNFYGLSVRRLPLNTVPQYQQIQQLYIFSQVYSAVLNVWYKITSPPNFFMASSSIVVCLYITFRHTELPIFIYCFYPYLAFLIFVTQFGLCYDGLIAIIASQEVVCRMRSRHMKCFRRMSQQDRAIALRWGKAMRPIQVDVGTFTKFNIGVPLGLWDEIVNQLVFLLTL